MKLFSAFACALLCGALALTGCGPKDGLVSITGTVTVDGSPVPSGSINFGPKDNQDARPTGAQIVNGQYEARVATGAMAVVVYAQHEEELADATAEEIERGANKTVVNVELKEKPGDDVLSADIQKGGVYNFDLHSKGSE